MQICFIISITATYQFKGHTDTKFSNNKLLYVSICIIVEIQKTWLIGIYSCVSKCNCTSMEEIVVCSWLKGFAVHHVCKMSCTNTLGKRLLHLSVNVTRSWEWAYCTSSNHFTRSFLQVFHNNSPRLAFVKQSNKREKQQPKNQGSGSKHILMYTKRKEVM